MAKKAWQRKPKNRSGGGRVTNPKSSTPQRPPKATAQIPRPSITEFTRITTVPVLTTGQSGPASGVQGSYQVTFVLGVPGLNSVATEVDFDAVLRSGDSLFAGTGMKVEYALSATDQSQEFFVSANGLGRLDQVELTVSAESFTGAERAAHDLVMPILSRMAMEADVPVEVRATVIMEISTQIRQVGATLVGKVKIAPEFTDVSTTELRPLLAAYREGLNCNIPSYQAVAFYKIIEGVDTFSKTRRRAARQKGKTVPDDPLLARMPTTLIDVPDGPPWSKDRFVEFFGKTYQEVKDSFGDVIRNAAVHLTPGRDLRVPDYMEDVEKCREAVPILRYIARELIMGEIAKVRPMEGPLQATAVEGEMG